MVEIAPFTGIRYNLDRVPIKEVVCPPYDIISPSMREQLLARHQYNYVRIVYNPSGHQEAKKLFDAWRAQHILLTDERPRMYVYEQEFVWEGKTRRRRCLVCALALEPFGKGKVFPHEQTFSGPKEDRLVHLRLFQANTEPILGMYTNGARATEIINTSVQRPPLFSIEDDWGIVNRLWVIEDAATLTELRRSFTNSAVIIADGHHRYETALQYAHEQKTPSAQYILIMLAPATNESMMILPTHRLVKGIDKRKLSSLSQYFERKAIPSLSTLLKEMRATPHTLGLYETDGGFALLRLKKSVRPEKEIEGGQSAMWKSLDVSLLHELVLSRVLGFDASTYKPEETIAYTRDPEEAVARVKSGAFDLAFFLTPPTVDDVRMLAVQGEKMPHKSTYFWPKQLSGVIARLL